MTAPDTNMGAPSTVGDPAELLKRLANGLTNKLIHRPTVALRDASANERDEVIRVVSQMFALDTSRD